MDALTGRVTDSHGGILRSVDWAQICGASCCRRRSCRIRQVPSAGTCRATPHIARVVLCTPGRVQLDRQHGGESKSAARVASLVGRHQCHPIGTCHAAPGLESRRIGPPGVSVAGYCHGSVSRGAAYVPPDCLLAGCDRAGDCGTTIAGGGGLASIQFSAFDRANGGALSFRALAGMGMLGLYSWLPVCCVFVHPGCVPQASATPTPWLSDVGHLALPSRDSHHWALSMVRRRFPPICRKLAPWLTASQAMAMSSTTVPEIASIP